MNLYETQDFFKEMYPGKDIKYEFDEACHRAKEFIFTDGKPNCIHHIDCDKVKVTVEGMDPKYVKIGSHRLCATWAEMKQLIASQNDVYIHPADLQVLKELTGKDDYKGKMNDLMCASGLSQSAIEAKLLP